jgi:hypothetical protein
MRINDRDQPPTILGESAPVGSAARIEETRTGDLDNLA